MQMNIYWYLGLKVAIVSTRNHFLSIAWKSCVNLIRHVATIYVLQL